MATEYTKKEPRDKGFGKTPFGDKDPQDAEFRPRGFGEPKTKYTTDNGD
jgi:hypothetical protein